MLWKTLWEKKKMLVTSIFSSSHSVFRSIKEKIIILANFDLSSASGFNLVMSKNLSFGKGLTPYFDGWLKLGKSNNLEWSPVSSLD